MICFSGGCTNCGGDMVRGYSPYWKCETCLKVDEPSLFGNRFRERDPRVDPMHGDVLALGEMRLTVTSFAFVYSEHYIYVYTTNLDATPVSARYPIDVFRLAFAKWKVARVGAYTPRDDK